MNIQPRSYTVDDLPRLLAFVGHANAAADLAVTIHPGDLAHALTNTMRGADPAPYFHIVDGPDGSPLAVVQLFKGNMFDYVVHPEHRGGELERLVLEWAARAQQALMARTGVEEKHVVVDGLSGGDPIRDALLAEADFTAAAEPHMAITVREIDGPIPPPALPEGFTIRPAAGLHEADAIGALHGSAFTKANWTPGRYLKVMETPGFDVEREMLVVAPDGELAAFLVYWLDPISRSGLFEPVGCAPKYQRRGLTKALMYHTLGLMRDAGMTRAMVKHETDNPASTAAYAAVGFARVFAYLEHTRPLVSGLISSDSGGQDATG